MAMTFAGARLAADCKNYISVMSPYNFDPEADALSAELKRAEKSGNISAIKVARENIRIFVERKTAAREAHK